jgi:hypothetical protein
MLSIRSLALSICALIIFAGCTSATVKARRDQRERMVKEGGKIYCEFMNGEQYPDIDIAMNLEMAKRCDPDKAFTISNYKTPAETVGLMYCCTMSSKVIASAAKHDDKTGKDSDEFSLDEKPSASKPSAPSTPSASSSSPKADAKPKNDPKLDNKDKLEKKDSN